jgi:hypothetical protein
MNTQDRKNLAAALRVAIQRQEKIVAACESGRISANASLRRKKLSNLKKLLADLGERYAATLRFETGGNGRTDR